jgi:hypothetical protein
MMRRDIFGHIHVLIGYPSTHPLSPLEQWTRGK